MFECFATWRFAAPALAFDIWNLDLDFTFTVIVDWRFSAPSELIEAARQLARLAFLASLLMIVAALGNIGAAEVLSYCVEAYDNLGKNVPLGDEARMAASMDAFLNKVRELPCPMRESINLF